MYHEECCYQHEVTAQLNTIVVAQNLHQCGTDKFHKISNQHPKRKHKSARAYFMCENPSVVCHLAMPRVFEVDGAFRAEEQGALQASQGGGGVTSGAELDEGHWAGAAAVTAAQQAQPREPRATARYTQLCRHSYPSVICVYSYY